MPVVLLICLPLAFGAAYWNARIAGKIWLESKAVGGWIRLVAWCGAALSAVGFTLVYALFVGIPLALYLDIDLAFVEFSAYWFSILIAPIALAAVTILAIESWRRWYRNKSLLNLGLAGWNSSSPASSLLQKSGAVKNAVSGLQRSLRRKKTVSTTHSISSFGPSLVDNSNVSLPNADLNHVVSSLSSIGSSSEADVEGSFGGGDAGGSGSSGSSDSSSDSSGSSDSNDSWKLYLALFVIIIAVCAGYWTTHAIMKKHIGTDPLPFDEARFVS